MPFADTMANKSPETASLRDFLQILRRRRWVATSVGAAIFAVGAAIAAFWPAV